LFVHCEDAQCGFLVEFKHPNCTFYFCKKHRTGYNLDLNTVSFKGVECEIHGPMDKYDILKEDNICPRCGEMTLAIVSSGNTN
jgi:predicted nucleic acid binding AN1-type Zn finger protein